MRSLPAKSHRNRRPTFRAAVKALTASSLALGATLSLSPLASANTEDYWTGTTGNFDDTTWSQGNSPNVQPQVSGNYTNGDVFNGGTVNVTGTDKTNDMNLGGTGNGTTGAGTLNVTSGTLNVGIGGGWFRLGTSTGTSGTFNLSGGVVNFGSLTADGATTFTGTSGNQFNIGEQANTTGVVNLTGGTFNALNGGGETAVGQGGTGSAANPNGTLNLGPGATFNSNGQLWIGNNNGSFGVMNMTGGTYNQHNWLSVGRAGGNGTFNISGGNLTVDTANDANSHVDIAGAGGTNGSVGVVNQTGGNVTINGNTVYMGENLSTAGSATYNLSNNATLTANAGITLGVSGAGTATFNLNGGTLSITAFTAGTSTGAKVINFNGGTLTALGASNALLGGTAVTANVRAGGAILNTNGFNVTINTPLVTGTAAGTADGGLTKQGTGVLTLSGVNTYTGPTAITAGSIALANTGNQTLVGNITGAGALAQTGTGITTLSGTNTYTGGTSVTAGTLDVLTPGSLPGFATNGAVPVSAGATLAVGYGGANSFTSAQVDALRASGDFAAGSNLGFDTTQATATATYASNITDTAAGALGITKLGANVLALTGTNTYSGGTLLRGGLLNFASLGNLGTGGITFNGGGLQFATGTTTDITTRTVTIAGAATVDTNGNNVTFAGPIAASAAGSFTKAGTGNLTLTGGFTFATGVASLGNLFVQQGALTLSGASQVFNSGGNYGSIGQNPGNFGTLNVTNGASYTTTGDFNVADVGGVAGSTTLTQNGGVVNLSGTGSTMSVASLFVGKGGNTATNGALAVGVVNQSGGTFTSTANAQIGSYGQGQYNLTGGTLVHSAGFTSIGRQTGSFGTLDVNGGTYNDTAAANRVIVGELGTGVLNVRGTTAAPGVVNISSATNASGGTLTSALAALTIGNTAGAAAATPTVGVVNLLPNGTINTLSVGSVAGAANLTSQLNFNGGTLANTAASPTFIQNLTQANVFSGGAIINTAAGNATISQPLIAPAGNGVTAITTNAGTGTFSTTPIVQITGGGGVGATAVATLDVNGNISGYTITNPGTGYTTAPTVTITGASGTAYTGTTILGANASGGLTKIGANTLTLTGANTYTGVTTISAGTLALGTGGSLTPSIAIRVGGGATFDTSAITFTSGAGQTLAGTGTINAGANVFTVNGTVSPGATSAAGDIGTLSIASTGQFTLANTATLQFDITNAATKDLLSFSGTGATLNVSGTLALRGTITTGTAYTIASGLTAENGNFTSVTGVPASYVPTYSFTGGNYNVTFSAVPEPSTWALGVFGLGGMAAVWMRRRRVA